MTGSLSDSVVVSASLRGIELSDGVRVLADDLLSTLSKHLLPRLQVVVTDAFSDVIPVKTHAWDKLGVELLVSCLIRAVLDDQEERAGAEARGVSNLRPVVGEACCHERHQLTTEVVEPWEMLCLFDTDGRLKDCVDDEVGDLPHKSVKVRNRFDDDLEDDVEVERVQVRPNCLDQVLQISHRSFQTLPSFTIVHGLAR